MIVETKLVAGQIIHVQGPLRISIKYGQVLILGAIFNTGDEVSVSKYRSYSVKALTDTMLHLHLEPGSMIKTPKAGEEPLENWVYNVDKLLLSNCKKFVVIGSVESGKSSLSALIANRALLRGFSVAIIDADIGQADIGPPTTVSMGIVNKPILWLRELTAARMRFIGSITPSKFEHKIVGAVVDLVNKAIHEVGVDVVVVDTDGWVDNYNAINYKVEIARLINTDSVIVLKDDSLYNIVSKNLGYLKCGTIFLPSPRDKKTRDRVERKTLRREAYSKYLQPMYERQFSLNKLSIQGSCILSSNLLSRDKLVELSAMLKSDVIELAGIYQDTLYILSSSHTKRLDLRKLEEIFGLKTVILSKEEAIGTVVGLISSSEEKAIGIIKDINFENRTITILTNYKGPVDGIIFGNVRLDENLEEIGRYTRCII